jgi:glutamate-1-semialdehyde 2,1-aminomutase
MSYTESRYVSPPAPVLTSIKTTSVHGHSRSRNSSITTLRGPATPYDPLAAAVSTAQARYTIANPKSLEAHNEACHHMPGGNTRTVLHATPFPLTWSMSPHVRRLEFHVTN